MPFIELAGFTGTAEATRAQARLYAVKPLIDGLGALYTLIASLHVVDPEAVAVLTLIIDNHKASIAAYLTGLNDVGRAPLDQAAAERGRTQIKTAKVVLEHLQSALPAMAAPVVSDEEGKAVVALTTSQRAKIEADITRAVNKLASLIS